MTPGTLVKFVHAAPRWKSEPPRPPGQGLLGQLAVVIEYAGTDAHDWGGVWRVHHLASGNEFMHWGDFMEPVDEGG
jgi:hypothetical protein